MIDESRIVSVNKMDHLLRGTRANIWPQIDGIEPLGDLENFTVIRIQPNEQMVSCIFLDRNRTFRLLFVLDHNEVVVLVVFFISLVSARNSSNRCALNIDNN